MVALVDCILLPFEAESVIEQKTTTVKLLQGVVASW